MAAHTNQWGIDDEREFLDGLGEHRHTGQTYQSREHYLREPDRPENRPTRLQLLERYLDSIENRVEWWQDGVEEPHDLREYVNGLIAVEKASA